MKNFSLGEKERIFLEEARRLSPKAKVLRRAQALLWLNEGRSVTFVAHLCSVSRQTVYDWIERYRGRGRSKALEDGPRPGRPKVMNQKRLAQLEETLSQDPQRLGYRQTTWTVPLLVYHLRAHHGLAVSGKTIRRSLHKLGYRWKRPRYVLAHKDPQREVKKGQSAMKWVRLQKGPRSSLETQLYLGSSHL